MGIGEFGWFGASWGIARAVHLGDSFGAASKRHGSFAAKSYGSG
jgi:hypothetical protein